MTDYWEIVDSDSRARLTPKVAVLRFFTAPGVRVAISRDTVVRMLNTLNVEAIEDAIAELVCEKVLEPAPFFGQYRVVANFDFKAPATYAEFKIVRDERLRKKFEARQRRNEDTQRAKRVTKERRAAEKAERARLRAEAKAAEDARREQRALSMAEKASHEEARIATYWAEREKDIARRAALREEIKMRKTALRLEANRKAEVAREEGKRIAAILAAERPPVVQEQAAKPTWVCTQCGEPLKNRYAHLCRVCFVANGVKRRAEIEASREARIAARKRKTEREAAWEKPTPAPIIVRAEPKPELIGRPEPKPPETDPWAIIRARNAAKPRYLGSDLAPPDKAKMMARHA